MDRRIAFLSEHASPAALPGGLRADKMSTLTSSAVISPAWDTASTFSPDARVQILLRSLTWPPAFASSTSRRVRGPFLVSKASLPIMQRQGSGHIVNVASTAATRAWANASAYHASKWGLVGFSRGLGVECRPFGVRVTTIIPGGMKTHFFDRFVDQGIPMPEENSLQDPANVASVILFAVQMPNDSAIQEVVVTPLMESSWP